MTHFPILTQRKVLALSPLIVKVRITLFPFQFISALRFHLGVYLSSQSEPVPYVTCWQYAQH